MYIVIINYLGNGGWCVGLRLTDLSCRVADLIVDYIYTDVYPRWGRRPQRHMGGGGLALEKAVGSRRRLPPQALRYIQGSSLWAPRATLGSVPCACVLVSPLYYKPCEKNKYGLYKYVYIITFGTEDGGSDCVGNICRAAFPI